MAAAVAPAGIVARMFSVALADVLRQDFVDAMRARGLKQAAIVRHAMHNALPSLLTITGLQLGYLLGGVLFVETILDCAFQRATDWHLRVPPLVAGVAAGR